MNKLSKYIVAGGITISAVTLPLLYRGVQGDEYALEGKYDEAIHIYDSMEFLSSKYYDKKIISYYQKLKQEYKDITQKDMRLILENNGLVNGYTTNKGIEEKTENEMIYKTFLSMKLMYDTLDLIEEDEVLSEKRYETLKERIHVFIERLSPEKRWECNEMLSVIDIDYHSHLFKKMCDEEDFKETHMLFEEIYTMYSKIKYDNKSKYALFRGQKELLKNYAYITQENFSNKKDLIDFQSYYDMIREIKKDNKVLVEKYGKKYSLKKLYPPIDSLFIEDTYNSFIMKYKKMDASQNPRDLYTYFSNVLLNELDEKKKEELYDKNALFKRIVQVDTFLSQLHNRKPFYHRASLKRLENQLSKNSSFENEEYLNEIIHLANIDYYYLEGVGKKGRAEYKELMSYFTMADAAYNEFIKDGKPSYHFIANYHGLFLLIGHHLGKRGNISMLSREERVKFKNYIDDKIKAIKKENKVFADEQGEEYRLIFKHY